MDGSKNTAYGAGSCTHTQFQSSSWCEVALPTKKVVFSVSINNRDVVASRLDGATITVSGRTCATGIKVGAGETQDIQGGWPIKVKDGDNDKLRITVPGDNKVLTLCEVQVWEMTSEDGADEKLHQWARLSSASSTTNNLPYNLQSVMHYKPSNDTAGLSVDVSLTGKGKDRAFA